MKIRIVLLLIIINIPTTLLLVDCGKRESEKSTMFLLEGKPFKLSTNILNNPFNCTWIDNFLLVEDFDKEFQHKVINLINGEVSRTGKVGDGPDELAFPTTIYRLTKPGLLGLNVRSKFTFFEITLKDFLSGKFQFSHTNSVRLNTNYQKVVKVNDSTYLGVGIFKNRYAVSDEAGHLLYQFGEYPHIDKMKGKRWEDIAMAYQGDIDVKPDGTRLVFSAEEAVYLEIINAENGRKFSVQSTLAESYPDFSSDSQPGVISAEIKKSNIRGFRDLSVTNRYIYALFSGETYERVGDLVYAPKTLMVYDWEGYLIAKLSLSHRVTCIAVDDQHKNLYAITYGSEPNLMIFDLPELSPSE